MSTTNILINKGKKWKPEDDDYLRENCMYLTMLEMMTYLQRSEGAVESRIAKLVIDNEESVTPKDFKHIDIKSIMKKQEMYDKKDIAKVTVSKPTTQQRLNKQETDIIEIKDTLKEILNLLRNLNKMSNDNKDKEDEKEDKDEDQEEDEEKDEDNENEDKYPE